jgi:hypothetical protein
MCTCAIERVCRIENTQLEQLTWIIPLVERMADVEPFIALKSDQIGGECRRRSRGERRFADARLSLEKERPLEAKRQEESGSKAAISDVVLFG